MARLKVLISGRGIAGNALAFWLSKLGHDITVIERFSGLRASGLQIDLRGHGIEVLKRMGLEEAFRSKAAQEEGIQIVGKSGRRWAYFPANKSGDGLQSFTSEYEIMRGDLVSMLYDATKSRAKYIFGDSIESFEQTDNSVDVRFTNGTTDRFDLLVGADGQGSRTRRTMLGSNSEDGFHPLVGLYVGYFTMPLPIKEGEKYIASAYTATRRRAIMTRRHSPHAIQVYLTCRTDPERIETALRGDIKDVKKVFTEIFEDAGWKAEEVLKALPHADDFYCERMGIVKLDSWSHGRVALLGDAAYCPSANTGMGTTCSVVGAYVLAGEIGRYCGRFDSGSRDGPDDTKDNLGNALKAYEQKFRPFMDQVQKGVMGDTWDLMPSTTFTIAIMNSVLAIASLLRLNVIGEWILHEDVKGWDLPEYEELLRK